ncbi:MAG: response regulator receiver modulated serine phosphatase [Bacilli bacterium]|nr:response regulator receiver modulated serine phosphatase [Bacilli bacterium]
MSIIIVDDNAINLLLITKILKNAGYDHLVSVSSAMELYSLLKIDSITAAEVSADLILMDMMMPEIDGLAACRRLQENERLRDIPIIFVTAVGDPNKLADALDAGATDYVMKPINKVELLARVRSALRLKSEKDWHKARDKRIRIELELAKQVQRSVLSQSIDDEKLAISAVYQPSFELAGDLYVWHRIDENRYGIILLDMMGHGISSSLVCMFISSVLQDTIKHISDPKHVVQELNRYMNQLYMTDELINYYFTAIYLVLNTEQKTIEYVNAGHPPGLAYVDERMVLLEQGCCAIGFFENIDISVGKIQYENQVKIVLFTDGLIDSTGDGREEGIDQFMDELTQHKDLNFAELRAKFIPEENNGNQQDDICLVMITTK